MLAVERRTTPIFRRDDSLDRRKVMLAERVVLGTEESSPTFIGLYRIDPTIHDPPAYERLHLLRPVPGMKHQSVHGVRSVIHGNLCKGHWDSSCSSSIIRMGR